MFIISKEIISRSQNAGVVKLLIIKSAQAMKKVQVVARVYYKKTLKKTIS